MKNNLLGKTFGIAILGTTLGLGGCASNMTYGQSMATSQMLWNMGEQENARAAYVPQPTYQRQPTCEYEQGLLGPVMRCY